MGRNCINRAKPTGVTPLTSHILRIEDQIQQIAPSLRQSGQRVSLNVAFGVLCFALAQASLLL